MGLLTGNRLILAVQHDNVGLFAGLKRSDLLVESKRPRGIDSRPLQASRGLMDRACAGAFVALVTFWLFIIL